MLGFLIIIASVGAFRTFAEGQKILKVSNAAESVTSENMPLLESHLNANPTSNTPDIAVADNSAIVGESHLSGDTGSLNGIGGGNQIYSYVVRNGDTLSSIAQMFDVSVNTIRWANNLSGSTISPGETLVILPISGVQHIVVKGDTVQSIAKKYNADVNDILTYNGLTLDSKLSAGDEVIVPDGEINSVSSSTPPPSSSSLPVQAGYYMRPLIGGVKTQGIHGHNGVDLGGLPIGTKVMAAASGTVIVARTSGYNGGYGLYVVISHSNGTQTLYAHLSEVDVTVGEKVTQGETIGLLGTTGRSTGPHLHFEVRGARNPF